MELIHTTAMKKLPGLPEKAYSTKFLDKVVMGFAGALGATIFNHWDKIVALLETIVVTAHKITMGHVAPSGEPRQTTYEVVEMTAENGEKFEVYVDSDGDCMHADLAIIIDRLGLSSPVTP